jgi:hypothetical protein
VLVLVKFQTKENIMLSTILLVIAFVLFVLAAIPVAVKLPVQLVPAGLACWVLSQIIILT